MGRWLAPNPLQRVAFNVGDIWVTKDGGRHWNLQTAVVRENFTQLSFATLNTA